jgi:hypothetical protein
MASITKLCMKPAFQIAIKCFGLFPLKLPLVIASRDHDLFIILIYISNRIKEDYVY